MLTGAAEGDTGQGRRAEGRQGRAQHPALHRRRRRRARPGLDGQALDGDNVFSSGDLVEDLTHNFFLETGARNNKLKVYEMVDHPAARALTGYLLVRGGVHQVAYARALENLTGADLMKLFPSPRIPTDKIPECKPHIKRGEHLKLYRFSAKDFQELAAVFNGPHPETGEDLAGRRRAPARGRARRTTCRRRPRSSPRARARGDRRDRRASCARPPACPRSRPASWPTGKAKANCSTRSRSKSKASAR